MNSFIQNRQKHTLQPEKLEANTSAIVTPDDPSVCIEATQPVAAEDYTVSPPPKQKMAPLTSFEVDKKGDSDLISVTPTGEAKEPTKPLTESNADAIGSSEASFNQLNPTYIPPLRRVNATYLGDEASLQNSPTSKKSVGTKEEKSPSVIAATTLQTTLTKDVGDQIALPDEESPKEAESKVSEEMQCTISDSKAAGVSVTSRIGRAIRRAIFASKTSFQHHQTTTSSKKKKLSGPSASGVSQDSIQMDFYTDFLADTVSNSNKTGEGALSMTNGKPVWNYKPKLDIFHQFSRQQ